MLLKNKEGDKKNTDVQNKYRPKGNICSQANVCMENLKTRLHAF